MFIFVSLLIIYYDSIYRFSFRVIKYIYYKIRDYFWNVCAKHYIFYPSEKLETNLDCNYWCTCAMGNHDRCRRNFMVVNVYSVVKNQVKRLPLSWYGNNPFTCLNWERTSGHPIFKKSWKNFFTQKSRLLRLRNRRRWKISFLYDIILSIRTTNLKFRSDIND